MSTNSTARAKGDHDLLIMAPFIGNIDYFYLHQPRFLEHGALGVKITKESGLSILLNGRAELNGNLKSYFAKKLEEEES